MVDPVQVTERARWGAHFPASENEFLAAFRARAVNTVGDTSRFMGVSTKTIYEMIQRGQIEVFHAGRRKLVLTRPLLLSLGENPSPDAE